MTITCRIAVIITAVVFVFANFFAAHFELIDFDLEALYISEDDALFCENMLLQGNKSSAKTILMASTYFETNYFEEAESSCSAKCIILPQKCRRFPNILNRADVIVVHALRPDLIPALRDLKRHSKRSSNQVWVFLSQETPLTLERIAGRFQWSKLNGLFNWSASYRRDSDVFIPPSQFDGFEEIPPIYNASFNTSATSLPRRHLAAVISNCDDLSGRLKLLRELSSFGMTVDIYGRCSPNGLKCDSHDMRTCLKQLNGRYYFYASFENSICRDYLTEKFYWALDYDFVPVVLGAINDTTVPTKSFIDASNFSSSLELAKYLQKVASNPELFNSFIEWKQHFRMRSNPDNLPLCSICRKLYEPYRAKVLNVEQWWMKNSNCHGPVF